MRHTFYNFCSSGRLALAGVQSRPIHAQDTPKLERFSPDQVDKTLDPCNDFFDYACSKWIKANPIPADQAGWGTFNSLAIWNVAAVHETLESAAKPSSDRTPAARTPIEAQVGDYYASCMDTDTINKLGMKPLEPVFNRISSMKSKAEVADVLALVHRTVRPGDLVFTDAQYNGVLFGLYAMPDFDNASITLAAFDQSGMGLPSKDFYSRDDEKSKSIREKYVAHIAKQLELSGERKEQAARDAKAVMRIETGLANGAMDLIPRRDPKNQNNKMSLAAGAGADAIIQPERLPRRHASAAFAAISGAGARFLPRHRETHQFRILEQLAGLSPLLNDLQSAVPERSVCTKNASTSSAVRWRAQKQIQPRWRRCSFSADVDLGEAVGQAYVAKYFPPRARTHAANGEGD